MRIPIGGRVCSAASLAVSVRANVKAVQRMLGHAKASVASTSTPKTSTKLRTAGTTPSDLLGTATAP
jgi:hypothetical protein